jgi:hypothetical protein
MPEPPRSNTSRPANRGVSRESSLLVVKNAGHAFEPIGGPIDPDAAEIVTRIADFFDRHLR